MSSSSKNVTPEELGNTCRSWSKLWKGFLDQHQQWWKERVGDNLEPAYTLPEFVLSGLVTSTKASGNTRALNRLLSEDDEKAERDFRTTCQRFLPDVIGVWRGEPVRYSPLFPVEENLGVDDPQLQLLMEWDAYAGVAPKQIRDDLMKAREQLVLARHQSMGYVGLLNSNEQFNVERDDLQELWRKLPPDSALPTASAILLAPPVSSDQPPTTGPLSMQLNDFYDPLRKCIHKWNLTGFATWDLPLPQGRLTALPAGLITQLRGSDATVDFSPDYRELPSRQNLNEELRNRQKREGEMKGVKCEFPLSDISARRRRKGGVGYEMSAYETKFRLWFAATTVKSRYGDIHGTKVRLDKAFAAELNISEERVKKHRTEYEKVLKTFAR